MMSFSYYNPVQIHFDVDILESLQNLAKNGLAEKRILLVTSKSFNRHSACGTISAESSKIAQSLTFSKLNRNFFDNHQTSSTILECQDFGGLSLGNHLQNTRIVDSVSLKC